jgi:hypothetical protein
MKRWSYLAALFIALASTAIRASQPNLLANPGFELPTSTTVAVGNWFRFGSGANASAFDATASPHSGAGHVGLGLIGANQFAGVFQDLPVSINPGQRLVFTGWHKSLENPFNATSEMKFEWIGAPQNRVDLLAVGADYEMFKHSAIAPLGTVGARITYAISSLGANQGNAKVYIDDFSVTIVPEPATACILAVGFISLLGVPGRMRRLNSSVSDDQASREPLR